MTALLMKITFLPLAEQIWNQGNSGACISLSAQTPFEPSPYSLKDREYWNKGDIWFAECVGSHACSRSGKLLRLLGEEWRLLKAEMNWTVKGSVGKRRGKLTRLGGGRIYGEEVRKGFCLFSISVMWFVVMSWMFVRCPVKSSFLSEK